MIWCVSLPGWQKWQGGIDRAGVSGPLPPCRRLPLWGHPSAPRGTGSVSRGGCAARRSRLFLAVGEGSELLLRSWHRFSLRCPNALQARSCCSSPAAASTRPCVPVASTRPCVPVAGAAEAPVTGAGPSLTLQAGFPALTDPVPPKIDEGDDALWLSHLLSLP